LPSAAARAAFAVHVDLPSTSAPRHPVLFCNPKSGGGKAMRFALAQEAGQRGIEAVELQPGDDLEALIRAAVARADGLAMAGGDGSQAIVAAIAAELGLPYACIPAGTRNHFARGAGGETTTIR
jgi:diacylglycerol kinase family enzyme